MVDNKDLHGPIYWPTNLTKMIKIFDTIPINFVVVVFFRGKISIIILKADTIRYYNMLPTTGTWFILFSHEYLYNNGQ